MADSILGGAGETPADGGGDQQQQQQVADSQQQQTPVAADWSKLIGADGAFGEKWRDALPEELRGEDSLAGYKTIGAMAKSLVSAQKMIGADKVVLPGKYATPEERREFFTRLGCPESAEGYQFAKPEDLPEGMNWNDDAVKGFGAKAHELGLTPEQAAGVLQFHTEMMKGEFQSFGEQRQAAQTEALAALKTEWGGAFNRQLELAKRTAQTFGVFDTLESLGLGDNAEVLKMLAKVGGAISEDKLKGGDPLVPADAQSRIDAIMNDMQHPYWDANHPGHDWAVRELDGLYKMLKTK